MTPDAMKIANEAFPKVLLRFFRDGWLSDPTVVNLPCFSKTAVSASGFECTCSDPDFSLCCAECYFPARGGGHVGCEFKVYYFRDAFWTNGLSLFTPLDLATALQTLAKQCRAGEAEGLVPSLYLDEAQRQGAIVLAKGLVLRFSKPLAKLAPAAYQLDTVEAHYSALEHPHAGKVSLHAVVSEFTRHDLSHLSHHEPVTQLQGVLRLLQS